MKEIRMVVFQDTEVISALIEAKQRAKGSLPAGTIAGLKKVENQSVMVTLRIVSDYGENHDVFFGPEEIAAALVGYCIQRRIRLPKGASKSVTLINGEIVLGMDVSHLLPTEKPKTKLSVV